MSGGARLDGGGSGADPAYWTLAGERWRAAGPPGVWRRYSDALHRELVARAGLRSGMLLLKTDLFEEAEGRGLGSSLGKGATALIGIDLAWSTAAAAACAGGCDIGLAADVRRLPFAAGSFGGVISLSTLDHFRDPSGIRQSLAELYRVLRPGGILVLTLDNDASPVVWLRNRLPARIRRRHVPYHVGPSWGPARLRTELRRAGFELRELTALMHLPRLLAVPVAGWIDRHWAPKRERAFLRAGAAWERLARGPLRFRTAHYLAVCAAKPGS